MTVSDSSNVPPEFTVTSDHVASGQLDGVARISPAHKSHALRPATDEKAGDGMTSVCDISLHYWESAQTLELPAVVDCRQCRALLPGYLEGHAPFPARASLRAENKAMKEALHESATDLLGLANDRNLWQEEAETWKAVAAVLLVRLAGSGLPYAHVPFTSLEAALIRSRSSSFGARLHDSAGLADGPGLSLSVLLTFPQQPSPQSSEGV